MLNMIRRWLDRRTEKRAREERAHEALRQRAARIAAEIISTAIIKGDGPMYVSEPRAINRFKHFHSLSAYTVRELVRDELERRTIRCHLQGFTREGSSDILWLSATFVPSPNYTPQMEV